MGLDIKVGIICKAYLTTKNNCVLIFCKKTGLEQEVSYHKLPHNKLKYCQKETENLFVGKHGRERREGGTRCIKRSRRTIRPFPGRSQYKDAYCTRCE